jgi:HEAT repeat protein
MWKLGLNALIAVLGLTLFVATPNAEEQMSSGRGRALGDSVGRLMQQLKDENPHTRMQAANALGQIKDVRAVKPLIAALKDENSSGRTQALAAGALVSIGTPAVDPLIAALKDENPLVRMQAADALGQIKHVHAVGS